jgi:hypothetical protein
MWQLLKSPQFIPTRSFFLEGSQRQSIFLASKQRDMKLVILETTRIRERRRKCLKSAGSPGRIKSGRFRPERPPIEYPTRENRRKRGIEGTFREPRIATRLN